MKNEKQKWSRKAVLCFLLGMALVLCALILAIGGGDGVKVKTNEDRVKFLENLGWEIDPEPVAVTEVLIPKDFSDVYRKFNELQIEQGYDLSAYQGEKATIYAYRIRNYTGFDGTVVAELYVVNDHIIGGDIHSLALNGFMHGLKRRPQT